MHRSYSASILIPVLQCSTADKSHGEEVAVVTVPPQYLTNCPHRTCLTRLRWFQVCYPAALLNHLPQLLPGHTEMLSDHFQYSCDGEKPRLQLLTSKLAKLFVDIPMFPLQVGLTASADLTMPAGLLRHPEPWQMDGMDMFLQTPPGLPTHCTLGYLSVLPRLSRRLCWSRSIWLPWCCLLLSCH